MEQKPEANSIEEGMLSAWSLQGTSTDQAEKRLSFMTWSAKQLIF